MGYCNCCRQHKGISTLLTAVVKLSRVEDVGLAAAACVISSKQWVLRRYWVRPSLKARAWYSAMELGKDLNKDHVDPLSGEVRSDGSFKTFLRMASCDFEHLILMIGHKIVKQDTNYRAAIPVGEKLVCCK
ncbi:hypothetical protein PR048_021155 [Dryococelus australis]|uniref:Uncharacterized protein n=1 Tax=Dryococelus australis TaxID=614101 RepID=A0ABQ9GXF3_9NEOP|nr:hypothetical protein PR048_021155 [Dryococelus australis]